MKQQQPAPGGMRHSYWQQQQSRSLLL